MVRGSQVALKHVIHDMETRTLVMELHRRAIKRWVPCGHMDRRLKIPHSIYQLISIMAMDISHLLVRKQVEPLKFMIL